MRINLRALHAQRAWHSVELLAVENEDGYIRAAVSGSLTRSGRRVIAKAHFGRLDGEYLVDIRFSEREVLDLVKSWLSVEPRNARLALLKAIADDVETDEEDAPWTDPPLPSGYVASPPRGLFRF